MPGLYVPEIKGSLDHQDLGIVRYRLGVQLDEEGE